MTNINVRNLMVKKNLLFQQLSAKRITPEQYSKAIEKINKEIVENTTSENNATNTLNSFRKKVVSS